MDKITKVQMCDLLENITKIKWEINQQSYIKKIYIIYLYVYSIPFSPKTKKKIQYLCETKLDHYESLIYQ